MAGIAEEAFRRLFPGREFSLVAELRYSGRFKDFNSIVRKKGNALSFRLSRRWLEVDREIVIGLLQSLLLKILEEKSAPTMNMELYESFVRNIHLAAPVANSDPRLEQAFARVNERYFQGLVAKPAMVWGKDSFRKLASYDYHTDTVTVSSLFRASPERVLEYLLYHELLHKWLKFRSREGRSVHHTAEFRRRERQFENSAGAEKEVHAEIRRMRRQHSRGGQARVGQPPPWGYIKI